MSAIPLAPYSQVYMSDPLEPTQDIALMQLDWLRTEGGFSIAELARRFRTSPAAISVWVNGHRKPSPMSCERIARLYQDERARRGLPPED